VLDACDLDACAGLATEVALAVTERIASRRQAPGEVSAKTSPADLVTATDLGVERFVRAAIGERFPRHRIIGEEFGKSGDDAAPATWWVDPVDGTTNFVHGLPWCSFSLCVADELGPAVAVVADPYRREVLSAVRGQGARVNGELVRCSAATSLAGGIVATEMVGPRVAPRTGELMVALSGVGCVTRVMGSNALAIAGVATGRALGAVIASFSTWDCLGPMLIAREGGALLTAAADPPREGAPMVLAAPGVETELVAIWRRVCSDE
jgi:myo-inositol-1(or 4)-monophosphatase